MRAILLIAFLVTCTFMSARAQEPAKTPKREGISKSNSAQISKQTDSGEQNDKHPTNGTPAIHSDQSASPCTQEHKAQTEQNIAIQRKLVTFTGLLAAVAFLQVVALLMQWWMIRRQAEHFRCSERTWVVGMPLSFSPELRPTWEPGDPPIPADERKANVHLFNVTIKNIGKTVAQIDETAARYVYVEQSLSTLPEIPDYGQTSSDNGALLVPNDEVWICVRLTTAVINRREAIQGVESGLLNRRQIAAIETAQDFLYAYGFVKYRDIFGKRRETRFGYVYHFPRPGELGDGKARFQPDGPYEYNKAT